MKRWCILRGALLPAGLLLSTPALFAFGTGAIEGVPLIGRPLDVVVPVTLDPGTDFASSCVNAEVMQGDTPIDSVQTRVESGANRTVVRVRTTRPIDEPVVTVTLNFGCFLKTTRKFVLFSDLPASASNVVPPLFIPATVPGPTFLPFGPATGAAPIGSGAQQSGSAARRRAAAANGESAGAAAMPRTPAGSLSPRIARPPSAVEGSQPQPATRQRAATAPAPAKRSQDSVVRVDRRNRLKLEPLDLSVDPEPKLKLTMSIDTVPQVTPQQRAEAAAIWRALNRTPTEINQDYERLQSMSTDLTAMRQHIQSNKAELDALRVKAEKAEEDRDRLMWLFGGVVLALVLALIAALLFRRRAIFSGSADKEDPNWWRDSKGNELTVAVDPADGPAVTPAPTSAAAELPQIDVDLDVFDTGPKAEAPAHEATTPMSAFGHLDFQGSQAASWRSLTTEELHDIQEQADFFVSLGDYDRAVSVLMTHVHASPQNSALAWMALLDLHHRLNRPSGYEGLRDQMERRMNVKVPDFEAYDQPSASLEAYADALARIVSLWPSQRVLDVIEESIYRLPGAGGNQNEPFELAAFEELLMLHAIAKIVVSEPPDTDLAIDDEAAQAEHFPMTSIQPLSSEISGPSEEDMLVLATLLAGSRVDINLDDEEKAVASLPSLPEVPKGAPLHDAQGWPVEGGKDNLIEFENFDDATSRLGKI